LLLRLQSLPGDAAPEFLRQGFIGHQALNGHGTPESQSPQMASRRIIACFIAITAEL